MNIITEQMLYEDKGGKNLHLEHIEDEILNYGVDGGRASINFIQSLRDMFAGATRSSINMTVKWDGAPAIFAGVDPEDNKFFVGKKSVFNVEPQLYKTNADIDKYTSGDLNAKFKVALEEFPKLGIKGVIQGDLMFTNDVGTQKIDGIDYYTFQPNTIVYAAAKDSDLGKQINTGKFNPQRLEKMIKVCKEYGLKSKEHNGDYLSEKDYKDRFDIGLDSINIAPEFGQIETKCYLDEMGHDIEDYFQICYDSKRWEKWVNDEFIPQDNKKQLIEICGHYVFSEDSFKSIKPNIDEKIQQKLREKLRRLSET